MSYLLLALLLENVRSVEGRIYIRSIGLFEMEVFSALEKCLPWFSFRFYSFSVGCMDNLQ